MPCRSGHSMSSKPKPTTTRSPRRDAPRASQGSEPPEEVSLHAATTTTGNWRRRLTIAAIIGILAVGTYFGLQALLREPESLPVDLASRLPPEPVDASQGRPPQKTDRPRRLPLDPLPPESGAELIAEARRVATDLAERFADNPDAHEMAARFHFEFGEPDAAEAAWLRCLELSPNYAYAHAGLGKLATERGDHAAAVAHWRRAIVADPGTLAHQLELGKSLLASGEVDEAVVVLKGAAEAAPASSLAQAELGSALLQKQDTARAQAAFEKALALDDELAAAHFGMATACARLGDQQGAQRHEARYAELRGDRVHEVQSARRNYDDDLALGEDIARLYTEMGSVCLAAGEAEGAELLWRRATRLHAESRASRQALAWLMRRNKKPLESILLWRELARLDPENPIYPVEMARVFVELKRVDDGLRVLTEFVETVPDSAAGQTSLAEYLLDVKRDPAQAAVHAQKAAESTGTAANWVLLSTARERQGNLPAAVAALTKATELAPDNLQLRQRLALLKERAPKSAEQPAASSVANPPSKDAPPAGAGESSPDGQAPRP